MRDEETSEDLEPIARPVGEDVRARARALTIALDGPAGSGKSSVATVVAERLGALHLDTGAIYRAITLACQEADIDLADGPACAAVAARVTIDQRHGRTYLEGRDVEQVIRGDAVSVRSSRVAT